MTHKVILQTNSIPIPILVCDWDGRIMEFNECAESLFVHDLSDLNIDNLIDFKGADIAGCDSFSGVINAISKRNNGLNSFAVPFDRRPVSYLSLSFSFIEDCGNTYVVIGIQDISDYKNHIKTAKYQQNLLDSMVAASNDALVVFDSLGYVELFSPAAERLFGVSAAEAVIADIYSLFEAGSHADLQKILEQVQGEECNKRPRIFENLPTIGADGKVFPSSVSFSRSQRDSDDLLFMIVSDKSLFYAFINSVDDAYIKTDESGCIIDANRKAEQIFCYGRDALMGAHISLLGIKRGSILGGIEDVVTLAGVNSDEDFVAMNRKGRELSLNLTVWPQVVNNTQLNNIIIKDISEKKRAEKQLIVSAYTDSLTGLSNREHFNHELTAQMEKSKALGRPFALLVVDLDKFKEVNDGYGHDYGDKLLKTAAKRLLSCVREHDLVARMGGDEFTIVIRHIHKDADAVKVAERILRSFRKDFSIKEKRLSVSSSIGIAIYPEDGASIEKLLKAADMAMYAAKKSGKDTYSRFSMEMHKEQDRRKQLERLLLRAIENNELTLNFQPKISFSQKQVVGFEALLRWYNPELGHVSPLEFIPIAEETGYIIKITRWVLANAISALTELEKLSGYFDGRKITIAVNISADHFKQDLLADIEHALEVGKFNPELLEIEITEGTFMEHSKGVVETLNAVNALGVHVSIDDFGTGYSSLQYLKYLRFNTLKIDRSFVRDIHVDKHNIFIVESIISIAKRMNLNLVAEGVESLDEIRYLAALGCDTFQGFYYSKPLPLSDIPQFLTRFTAGTKSS